MKDQARLGYFEVFGLEARFEQPGQAIEQAYRALAAEVHPDRFVRHQPEERTAALERSSAINEAYRTLRSPTLRGLHLLEVRGAAHADQAGHLLTTAILSDQLELREQFAEARSRGDAEALGALAQDAMQRSSGLYDRLIREFDELGDDGAAALTLQELQFVEKLREEIEEAQYELEEEWAC